MSNVADVLQEIEERAETENIPFVGPEKGQVLVDVIKKERARRILEVGTNIGYSTILMGSSIPISARNRAKIITVEIDRNTAVEAKRNIQKAGLEHLIEVITGDARAVIPALKNTFGMVFLDALKTQYLSYLLAAEPKLSKGATVVADNVGIFASSMRDYLEYVRKSRTYESETHDFGYDAVEVSRKID